MKTAIEYVDQNWNWLTGCTPVSEGCRYCYAANMSRRIGAMSRAQAPDAPPLMARHVGLTRTASDGRAVFNGTVRFLYDELDAPAAWKPARIFVNSMSDTFHPDVPAQALWGAFSRMCSWRQHIFLIFTKRPERAATSVAQMGGLRAYPHIWFITSVENQESADERLPHLMRIQCARRGVSMEPLLGPLDLSSWLDGIDWGVLGGESGTKARPMHPDWARNIRDQFVASKTPFFFRQWGNWSPNCLCATSRPHRTTPRPEPGKPGVMFHCGKKGAGRVLDGRTWDDLPGSLGGGPVLGHTRPVIDEDGYITGDVGEVLVWPRRMIVRPDIGDVAIGEAASRLPIRFDGYHFTALDGRRFVLSVVVVDDEPREVWERVE